ncbi:hypothetical protein TNCV_1001531 [Trichonephila clavipes]|nr:hypothetical protein TNCV_1001531 [Trichonephila clavipes]
MEKLIKFRVDQDVHCSSDREMREIAENSWIDGVGVEGERQLEKGMNSSFPLFGGAQLTSEHAILFAATLSPQISPKIGRKCCMENVRAIRPLVDLAQPGVRAPDLWCGSAIRTTRPLGIRLTEFNKQVSLLSRFPLRTVLCGNRLPGIKKG